MTWSFTDGAIDDEGKEGNPFKVNGKLLISYFGYCHATSREYTLEVMELSECDMPYLTSRRSYTSPLT